MTITITRLLGLAIFPPFLSGCLTIGPDYLSPAVVTPSQWNSGVSTGSRSLVDWWTVLRDPVLNQLIPSAIAASPDIAIAKARVRQSRAAFTSAAGVLYPTADAGFSATRSGSSGVNASTGTNVGFSSQWEIDLFGANRRGVQAAYYDAQSTDEQLRAALVSLIGDVTANYAQLRGVQASIAIAQRNTELQRQTVALIRNQLEAGFISQVDVLSAETQAETTEGQIPSLRITYAAILSNLSVLTGLPAFDLEARLGTSRPIPTVPTSVAVGLPADLLRNRPDIRAAERDYASSTANIGRVQGDLYPSVSLTGLIDTSGSTVGDLARFSTVGWSIGPSLTVPVFNAGRLNAEVNAARALRDQAFVTYRRAVILALSEVETASVALNQNRVRVSQQQRIFANSREIHTLTLEQYRAGGRSFLDVLTAQGNLLSAELALTQARADVLLAFVDLQRSLGGGWSGAVDPSQPEVRDGPSGPRLAQPRSRPIDQAAAQ